MQTRAARTATHAALAALSACAFASPAAALDPQRPIPQLVHAGYEEQLPQNTVLSIVQRRDGSLWFATYSGVARYSGAGFEAIDRRSAPALESTAITALLEDSDGALWIGTLNGGLYRIGPGEEAPARVHLPVAVDSVFALAQDRSGALWMGTNAGVLRRDESGDRLYGEADGVARAPIRAIAGDANGDIWVALDGAGVVRFHDGVPSLLALAHGLPDTGVFDVELDRAGQVWAGTNGGLVRWDGARFAAVEGAQRLAGKRVYTLLGDRDGNLWAAVDRLGLCRLAAGSLECDATIGGLGHDVVRSMVEDREGNVWIGATASGAHRLSDAELGTAVGALESNSVRAVHEAADGTLWVGTEGAGLATLRDGRLVPWSQNARLPSRFVRALQEDGDGTLWVGTIDGMAAIARDGRIDTLGRDGGLPGPIVFAFTPARGGALWIGTSGGLAHMRDRRIDAVPAVGASDIRALHVARDGTLWIGQRSGLQCLRPGGVVDRCGSDGLADTSVFAFHEDEQGSMWLGTSKGVLRSRGDAPPRAWGEREGLADDSVFVILDDGAGNFWTSSNRGIARTPRADFEAVERGELARLRPELFGKDDGMLSNRCNGASQSPGVRTRDGRLWFATARGIVLADPANLRRNAVVPLVAIERVVADAVALAPGAAARLEPGVETLELHYAAMSYAAPGAVRYRYRLDGFDRDWVDAGARRVAYYTGLPPGEYVFRVLAANDDGVWNDHGAVLAFELAPRWFETSWFRTLLALAALAALAAAYRVRLWRLRANERALTRVVAERTDELRAANAELTRMASLDGLTRIANRSAFDAALARLWQSHRESGDALAIVLCDIDAFKAYNDTYGHQAGDEALIRVAAALQALARPGIDVVARYGGEELALLLPGLALEQACAVAGRAVEVVRSLAIAHAASAVAPRVTLSAGVAAFVPDAATTAQDAIGAADRALYRAKAEGRDRVAAAPAR